MSFFRTCCNGSSEPYKKGVLHADGKNLESAPTSSSRSSRSYIPWVWSRKFHQTYQLGKVLGEGAHAIVHEATKITDPPPTHNNESQYAIKVIQRWKMNRQDMRQFNDEVQILLDLQHENIIHLYELYKVPYYIFMVMEKLDGGELFHRLSEKVFYSEKDARDVCRTIFEAMEYCHDQKVAHRDLKPENLLLVSPHDDTHVKIADFGFAKRVMRPNSLTTACGTPAYCAPEIVNHKPHDQRVDNWSLGVIVYTILGGYHPFLRDTISLTCQQIRQAAYQFDPEYWDDISPDAKNLIRGLLTVDSDKRLTVEQALMHPWMTGRGDDLKQHSVNVGRLKKFNDDERRKRANVKSVSFYWLVSRR